MKQENLKQKLFLTGLKAAILISIIAVGVNLIIGLPGSTNIKWIFLSGMSLITILGFYNKPFSDRLIFSYLLFMIVFFMPLGFISAGGGKSDYIAFLFFALIIVTYTLDGLYQKICATMLMFTFIALHVFEHFFPNYIPVYSEVSRFYDRLIEIPIMLIISYGIIKMFANAYKESNEQLFHCANYDMLTGLLNRWALSDFLETKYDSFVGEGYVVFMDIDNFKIVNDNFGHTKGDNTLREYGRILKKHFDINKNLICRWGGDEFVIFFFDAIDELDTKIKEARIDFLSYTKGIDPLIDISIGITSLEGCKSVEDVLVKSDKLMYEQKYNKKD